MNEQAPAADDSGQSDQPEPAAAADLVLSDAEGEEESEPPPPEPEWEVPVGVEQVILRFNEMHRAVFQAVRLEIGAGAVNFVRSCCIELAKADPLEGVQLHDDGSWDVQGLKRVIVERSIDDPWPAYQAVLDQEFDSLQPHLGEARASELQREIWEIEQA